MATVIRPPMSIAGLRGPSVFLAGTIDDGSSVDWQTMVAGALHDLDIDILNPRRTEWDASWVSSIDNPQFREQVEWELAALEAATHVLVYFAAGSRSPISLLELGLHARNGKAIVVCPDGFWKKGNVDVVCAKYRVPNFTDIPSALAMLRTRLT